MYFHTNTHIHMFATKHNEKLHMRVHKYSFKNIQLHISTYIHIKYMYTHKSNKKIHM
jgi:hypothetical protein